MPPPLAPIRNTSSSNNVDSVKTNGPDGANGDTKLDKRMFARKIISRQVFILVIFFVLLQI